MREVAANSMFISQMAFFARVSDPAIGGTYMTLLNTVRYGDYLKGEEGTFSLLLLFFLFSWLVSFLS